jgi:thiosulfate/3-mercaptopyruvate sulfurtransferase
VTTLLLDCRPAADYAAGHVPGALHVDPETALSDPTLDAAHGGRHPLPSDERLGDVFGALGVGADTFVLAYDEGSGWAARCWWLLRHLGHDLAGTIDLRGYAGPLVTEPATPLPRPFVAQPRADDVIEIDELAARLDDPALVLLDARSPERWRGDVEPLDPVAGRIPGARNAFFEEPLADSLEDLPRGAELAVYCGSGVTACVVVQRLVLAGRENVRMYPGSFSEWCRREGHPIERSTAP